MPQEQNWIKMWKIMFFSNKKSKYVVLTTWGMSVGGRQTFSDIKRSIFMENAPMFCTHQDNIKMKKMLMPNFGKSWNMWQHGNQV